ncbi:hypothetical protein [Jeotgalibacillus haloalkalitolerans]|uniref:hypothetical protein n=1 Tax=Jeotgalibacillus haloalkalitolerans TaxID=3104292 RepID=UPI002ACBFA0F|nr:hypothetical protein [Jeotgalibacillus sp. HH7-29]
MGETIKALMFDFTRDNLNAYEVDKAMLTSGENLLSDIMQFESMKYIESPFTRLIDIECDYANNLIKDEKMSTILGIDKENLFHYYFFDRINKKSHSSTKTYLSAGHPGEFSILASKTMLEAGDPIFEIRFKLEEKWSSWQAIAGKFIVAQNYRFGPGGVAEVYHSMTEKEIESFKQTFQIRYSGSIRLALNMPDTLRRMINDPFDRDIRKLIDPHTFQILFDSQLMHEFSSEKSQEIWSKFETRYR